MRNIVKVLAGLVACGLAAQAAHAQLSVGVGPSQTFITNLPSSGINRTLGGYNQFTTAARFFNRPSPGTASYLASPGVEVNLMVSTYRPVTAGDLGVGPGLGPLVGLKFRSIDSLSFDKRARFSKLRETTLALAEKIREVDQASLSQVSVSFRQFMFPLPLQDQRGLGYGFFSRLDLVGARAVDPEKFLGSFTQEVQQSLGEKRFLDVTQAMLFGQPLPKEVSLDQFYDPQLAALGNFLFNGSRYAAAEQAWAILVQRDAASATASRGLALCLLATAQTKKAAAEFRRSFALMQGWPDKVRIVGSNFRDVFPGAKDIMGIREELLAQLAKAPDDADLNFLMAVFDLFRGNLPEAEGRLAKVAAADPVAKGLLDVIQRGGVADTVKHPAEDALRRAATEVTGLEEPALSPQARARLIAVLRQGPETYEDEMRLGDFRFFMGDFTQAGEDYRAAHKLKPDDAFALFAMAHACFANGEYRQAVHNLEAALALEPNWGLYEFRLQEFYGDRSEYGRHLKDLERLLELRPSAADMRFLLAYVYYFSGRYADAADELTRVLQQDPNFAGANYFLRLARLQG
jgi:tetratricopeptide (TPR) repeat protein